MARLEYFRALKYSNLDHFRPLKSIKVKQNNESILSVTISKARLGNLHQLHLLVELEEDLPVKKCRIAAEESTTATNSSA